MLAVCLTLSISVRATGGASGVRHVHDAAGAVAAFAGQVQGTVFLENGTPSPYGQAMVWGAFHHHAGGVQVTQAGAGHQRVIHVGFKRCRLFPAQQCRPAPMLEPSAMAFGRDGHALLVSQVQRGSQLAPGRCQRSEHQVWLWVGRRCQDRGSRLKKNEGACKIQVLGMSASRAHGAGHRDTRVHEF
jgi:hypothetical protein